MQPFESHQSISSVLLLNSASSVRTTVTVNNSTQPVCNVSTVYRHQRPDHMLLNYQECRRHASMLENGQCILRICACQAFCPVYDIVNTCTDALKSLSTAAELAGVQFFMIKAFATVG